jgi:hypothetical protein
MSSRGGKRPNSGRKAIAEEHTERSTITILKSDRALLTRLGKGNLSRGVREAAALLREQKEMSV